MIHLRCYYNYPWHRKLASCHSILSISFSCSGLHRFLGINVSKRWQNCHEVITMMAWMQIANCFDMKFINTHLCPQVAGQHPRDDVLWPAAVHLPGWQREAGAGQAAAGLQPPPGDPGGRGPALQRPGHRLQQPDGGQQGGPRAQRVERVLS